MSFRSDAAAITSALTPYGMDSETGGPGASQSEADPTSASTSREDWLQTVKEAELLVKNALAHYRQVCGMGHATDEEASTSQEDWWDVEGEASRASKRPRQGDGCAGKTAHQQTEEWLFRELTEQRILGEKYKEERDGMQKQRDAIRMKAQQALQAEKAKNLVVERTFLKEISALREQVDEERRKLEECERVRAVIAEKIRRRVDLVAANEKRAVEKCAELQQRVDELEVELSQQREQEWKAYDEQRDEVSLLNTVINNLKSNTDAQAQEISALRIQLGGKYEAPTMPSVERTLLSVSTEEGTCKEEATCKEEGQCKEEKNEALAADAEVAKAT